MRIAVNVDRAEAFRAGKDQYGRVVVDIPAERLTAEEREAVIRAGSVYPIKGDTDFELPWSLTGSSDDSPPRLAEATAESVINLIQWMMVRYKQLDKAQEEQEQKKQTELQARIEKLTSNPLALYDPNYSYGHILFKLSEDRSVSVPCHILNVSYLSQDGIPTELSSAAYARAVEAHRAEAEQIWTEQQRHQQLYGEDLERQKKFLLTFVEESCDASVLERFNASVLPENELRAEFRRSLFINFDEQFSRYEYLLADTDNDEVVEVTELNTLSAAQWEVVKDVRHQFELYAFAFNTPIVWDLTVKRAEVRFETTLLRSKNSITITATLPELDLVLKPNKFTRRYDLID